MTLWDVSTGAYRNSYYVGGLDTDPRDVFFKPDGTILFVLGDISNTIYKFHVSPSWDITTSSLINSFYVGSQFSHPRGMFFKPNGSQLYVAGLGPPPYEAKVVQYYLNNWYVGSAAYLGKLDISSICSYPNAVYIEPTSGTKMYVLEAGTTLRIFQFTLSTPWTASTGVYTGKSLYVGTQAFFATGLFFKPEGDAVYITTGLWEEEGYEPRVFQYTLSTPWSIETGGYSGKSLYLGAQEGLAAGLYIKPDGNRLYITGRPNYSIHQYILPSVPVVTTQEATDVIATSVTGNGNITEIYQENVTRRGFCYIEGTTGDPTTSNSVAYDDGSFGKGAYSKSITGLSSGTNYRVRAYAVNSVGTAYGDTVQVLTLPAVPTNVQATDGAHTDKVVVTWTKSDGATAYQVYRDNTPLGWLGDVVTYNDTGADAPTITHGSIIASDGSPITYVALSNIEASTSNGTTHTYKIVAKNTAGESEDSDTDTGYRSVGALTYQWYRSAGDSDATYSIISGATSSTYNDIDAPGPTITPGSTLASDEEHETHVALSLSGQSANNGGGRYYDCYHTAEGATSDFTGSNRGYRGVGSLTYQWQRSVGDSDASYSNISGATSATYNDTNAPAPIITPGVASATDGNHAAHVALSLSGQTTTVGEGRYYKCVLDAIGCVQQISSSNRGNRGVGSLTYQWQRSASDSDVAHSNISGAIAASYDDTDAPADGSGRYYRCVEDATGATQQISTSDRGYRMYSPTVVTQAATSIAGTSATLNGNITDAGGPITTRGFEYYKEGDSENVLDVHEDGTFGEGVYGLPISDLINGTKYYFRAYATNDTGTLYGSWLDFTTEVYLPLVTTEIPSDISIDHAKGNGTIISGANIIERGFEVVLVFSGALQEYTDRKMAGFAGTATYSGTTKKWEGTLTKTITETGTFSAGAFTGDIGKFPDAITSDRLFAGELYTYKARATNDVGVGYGSWVALVTSSLPAGQLPDDQIPIDDIVGIFYYRKPYPKRDANELREKCRMFQDNIVEYALVINHNSRVLQRFLNDLTLYTGADEYNTFRPIIPPQHLNALARKSLDENDFKKIINSFINNSADNANNVNNNFQLIRGGLSDYTYTEDEGFVDISIRTKVIVDTSPHVEGLTRVIDRLNKEMADNYLVINHNSHVLRSILI